MTKNEDFGVSNTSGFANFCLYDLGQIIWPTNQFSHQYKGKTIHPVRIKQGNENNLSMVPSTILDIIITIEKKSEFLVDIIVTIYM